MYTLLVILTLANGKIEVRPLTASLSYSTCMTVMMQAPTYTAFCLKDHEAIDYLAALQLLKDESLRQK